MFFYFIGQSKGFGKWELHICIINELLEPKKIYLKTVEQGQKRSLDTPKRMIERERERERGEKDV